MEPLLEKGTKVTTENGETWEIMDHSQRMYVLKGVDNPKLRTVLQVDRVHKLVEKAQGSED